MLYAVLLCTTLHCTAPYATTLLHRCYIHPTIMSYTTGLPQSPTTYSLAVMHHAPAALPISRDNEGPPMSTMPCRLNESFMSVINRRNTYIYTHAHAYTQF